MRKLSSPFTIKSLSIIFQNCLKSSISLVNGERVTLCRFIKKHSTQLVNNHHPVSLLPICSKFFEKFIFDCHSGFRPNHSCVNQLIIITNYIYGAFDADPPLEVQCVFQDLSKAFGKV